MENQSSHASDANNWSQATSQPPDPAAFAPGAAPLNDPSNIPAQAAHLAPAEPQKLDEAQQEDQAIQKARAIIASTKDNPFMQSQQLSELRTSYLASRYGRSLESAEDK